MLALAIAVFYRLSVSWYGIAARAVREDPAVASSLGIAPRRIQTIAFVISGAVGGLGGMLLALVLQFLSPDTYFVNIAFTMIAAVVLGGSYHWVGAIIGAAVFTALPVIAQAIVPNLQDVANGVALLLIMIFLPRGLVDPRAIRLRRATAQARPPRRRVRREVRLDACERRRCRPRRCSSWPRSARISAVWPRWPTCR